jgi:hypothetical protein
MCDFWAFVRWFTRYLHVVSRLNLICHFLVTKLQNMRSNFVDLETCRAADSDYVDMSIRGLV